MTMMIIIIKEQLQILETASVNGIIDPCQAVPWSQLTYFTLGKNPRCTLTEVKKVIGSEWVNVVGTVTSTCDRDSLWGCAVNHNTLDLLSQAVLKPWHCMPSAWREGCCGRQNQKPLQSPSK